MAPDDDQNTGKQMSIVAYDMLVTTPKGHTVRWLRSWLLGSIFLVSLAWTKEHTVSRPP